MCSASWPMESAASLSLEGCTNQCWALLIFGMRLLASIISLYMQCIYLDRYCGCCGSNECVLADAFKRIPSTKCVQANVSKNLFNECSMRFPRMFKKKRSQAPHRHLLNAGVANTLWTIFVAFTYFRLSNFCLQHLSLSISSCVY